MRNLKLVNKIQSDIGAFEKTIRQVLPSSESQHEAYFRTDTDISHYDCRENSFKTLLAGSTKIIDWELLVLNNELCVACEDGEVLVINLTRVESESVTFCEGGIERMAWSPDQEVVAFVTAAKQVVVMNCTYDPISEVSLDEDNFGDQEFITVGWGKKETQFHGSEGKQAAKQKNEFIQPQDLSNYDQSSWISWRGDGEYFAVSFLASYGRAFKVFNKEGQLQYTAEKLNDLAAPIAWKPSGSWIAVPHRLPNKYTIGLFEKNGLRHREIILPFEFDNEPVVSLCWSVDSDILAVETVKNNCSNIYLYTIGNYHWYLKQSLKFECKIVNVRWDAGMSEQKTLHVLLESGFYLIYKWTFEVTSSIGNYFTNLATVGVIDGKRLLLTDFRNNVAPPPMSKCSLVADADINFFAFSNCLENQKQLLVVTSDNKLSVYDIETKRSEITGTEQLKGVKLLKEYNPLEKISTIPLACNHWTLLNEKHVAFTLTNLNESQVFLLNLETSSETSKTVSGQITAIAPISQNSFLIHSSDCHVLSVDIVGDELSETTIYASLPEECEHLQAMTINDSVKLFALKDNQNLYLNDTKLSSDVTSFFIAEHYFMYTQLNSLKFIALNRLPDTTVVSERRIERGGKLVTVVPKDSRTILQMPRGNLEAIQPRVLSLHIVGELLDESQYEKTMILLRKQRINLNIIFDHNPKKFISETEVFLSQISNAQWLNLFLTELQNEDFTQTMCASNYERGKTEYPEGYTIENKINFVCNHMCAVMKGLNDERFTLPIVTCYVKKSELENALDLIWSLKKTESTGRSKAEDALSYLLYMADVNELYNIALGMYDFDLVIFVASKSQKDPKEYVPFLNELKKLDENYRKFKIDDFLRRYVKAFDNIANCGEERFEECLEYVQKHNLHTVALRRFEKADGKKVFYQKIALQFADYLRTNGRIENAGVMYERGGDLKQAITSAKHVLDVVRCLTLAKKAAFSEDEIKNLALSLVPGLQSNSRFQDAYYLMKQYSDDYSKALSVLLDGRLYLEAVFEAETNSPGLVENQIRSHLDSYSVELCQILEGDKEKFLKYVNRLATVRLEKSKKSLDEDYVDESDLISETTSVTSKYTGTSRSSGKTFRSSKNRRKHERKLLNLKEGNKFEDIALIDALYKLSLSIFEQQQQISHICKALVELRSDENARQVQRTYRELMNTIKSRLDEIWIPEMMTSQQLLGPNIDYAQLQSDQHYAMLPPYQRFKPQLNTIDWENAILQ